MSAKDTHKDLAKKKKKKKDSQIYDDEKLEIT